ncbi:MAG: deoxynucleoside kinase [Bacteroidota bacterium]
MNYDYIAIEGNIGAGKTTLSKKIASEYDAMLILEQFEDNSFLPKFYNDPDRYAFPLELTFIAERYQQLKQMQLSLNLFNPFVIADYFIDKSLIFSRNTLSEDEYLLYTKLFSIINNSLPKPELLVYLHVNINRLLKNINNRGRDYEQQIKYEYLEKIEKGYFNHFTSLPDLRILIIDANEIDFVNNSDDYAQIKEIILSKNYPVGITRIVP